jgi:hypothetical protein
MNAASSAARTALPAGGLMGILRLLLVAFLMAGCSSGLTDAQWVWCQANRDAVKEAAATLGLVLAPRDMAHCVGAVDISSCIRRDEEFIKACRAIDAKYGGPPPGASDEVSVEESQFCDGASVGVGGGTHPDNAPRVTEYQFSTGVTFVPDAEHGTPIWELRGAEGERLRTDGDYGRACGAAFGASH